MSSYPNSSSLEDEKAPLLEEHTTNISNDSSASDSESERQTRLGTPGLRKRREKTTEKGRPRRTLSFELQRRVDEDAAIRAFKSDPRFNQPPPSVLSRLLLLAFLGFLIWLAVSMRMVLLDDKRHGKSRAASDLRHSQSAVVPET